MMQELTNIMLPRPQYVKPAALDLKKIQPFKDWNRREPQTERHQLNKFNFANEDLHKVKRPITSTNRFHQTSRAFKLNLPKPKPDNGIVEQAFNQIGDFSKKDQILNAIKSLTSIDQRVQLIDRILKRKDEMKNASMHYQMQKLAPILKIITKKLKKNTEPSEHVKQEPDKKGGRQFMKRLTIERVELETEQKALIDKMQSKATTSVALRWFYKRDNAEVVPDLDTPKAKRQKERQCTELRVGHLQEHKDQDVKKSKVKEYSDQFLLQGAKLSQDNTKRKNIQEIRKNARSRVDCHHRPQYSNPIHLTKEQGNNSEVDMFNNRGHRGGKINQLF